MRSLLSGRGTRSSGASGSACLIHIPGCPYLILFIPLSLPQFHVHTFCPSHSSACNPVSLAFPDNSSRGPMMAMRSNSRGPTAAETVAALKISMGVVSDMAGRATGRPPSSPPPLQQQQQQAQVFQLDPDEEPGELLGEWV